MKWIYNQQEMEYIKVDINNNFIKEYYENGIKYKYFKHYGYQPATFKECSTPRKQLDYCKSVNCPGCNYCVWVENMHLTPTNKPIKQKIIKTNIKPSKWDNLAKQAITSDSYSDCDHPLLGEILRVFKNEKA